MDILDGDPGDEHRDRAEDAPPVTVSQVREQFPTLVVQQCASCGGEYRWIPFGVATLPQWIAHFQELEKIPYYCEPCWEKLRETFPPA